MLTFILASPSTQSIMALRRRARDLERTYSRAQFVAKLRRFADAIESGKAFSIQVANERLRIPADATFNIEHERAGGTDELEFQIRWTLDSPGAPDA